MSINLILIDYDKLNNNEYTLVGYNENYPKLKEGENKITITADAIIFLPLNTLASLFTGFSIITATAYAITNGATKGKTYLKPAITDTVIITIPLIYCNFCLFVQYAFS